MDNPVKFKIKKDDLKKSSINRTIRIKYELFEKLMTLSEKNHVSFNKIVCQCIEYAIKNLDE
jgi:predicted HicB family RNase H-like nuclease